MVVFSIIIRILVYVFIAGIVIFGIGAAWINNYPRKRK
jgi:hypothetical protein